MDVDATHIPTPYPGSSTLETSRFLLSCLYGVITLYDAPFQETLSFQVRKFSDWSKHHMRTPSRVLIRFALIGFQSLLLTKSQLISFPAGTKMFQFPASLILSDSRGKSHSEILGSKAAYASPRLNAVSRVLHQRLEPSLPPDRIRISPKRLDGQYFWSMYGIIRKHEVVSLYPFTRDRVIARDL